MSEEESSSADTADVVLEREDGERDREEDVGMVTASSVKRGGGARIVMDTSLTHEGLLGERTSERGVGSSVAVLHWAESEQESGAWSPCSWDKRSVRKG